MYQRTNQGGSVVVYSIVGLVLALAAIGSVYAIQQRADGEKIGPMVAVQQDEKEQKPAEDKATNAADQKAAEDKKAQEEAAKQQAAEEEKAKRQQQEAAQQKAASEQKAAEQKVAQQKAAEERKAAEQRAAGSSPTPAPSQSRPSTQPLPQTGPADTVFAGAVLAILSIAIIRYAFSHKFVTGR